MLEIEEDLPEKRQNISSPAQVSSTRVLFIGGVGRSGSTLVERVLNEVPGICGLGEVAQTWLRGIEENRLCGCGMPFKECALWREIGSRAFGGWDQVDIDRFRSLHDAVARTRHIPWLASGNLSGKRREKLAEYVEYYTRIYAAAGEITGAPIIVDSSKHVALAFCLRWASHIDLRILHLVRDPRGVAYSWIKQVRDTESGSLVAIPKYPMVRCALSWNFQNAALDLLARVCAKDRRREASVHPAVLRMRYEEFVADPSCALDRLIEFVGLSEPSKIPKPNFETPHVELGILHSVSGNRMRFNTGQTTLRIDDAWQTSLGTGARRVIRTLCAPLLHTYGYSKGNPSREQQKTMTEKHP